VTLTPTDTITLTLTNTDTWTPTNTPTPTDTPAKFPDDPKDKVSDPVDTFKGVVENSITDIKLIGRNGFDFEISRYYRGDKIYSYGPFGRMWAFNYNSNIKNFPGDGVWFTDLDGQVYRFTQNTDGTFNNLAYLGYNVTSDGNEIIVHKKQEHRDYVYDYDSMMKVARLTRIYDRYNNQINFTYDSEGKLISIDDSLPSPRHIVFNYNSAGKISTITYGSITLTYSYDANGMLSGVDGPRLICQYQYNSNHQITYSSENTSAKGYAWTSYQYNSNGWVQTAQSPLGTMTFTYEMIDLSTNNYIPKIGQMWPDQQQVFDLMMNRVNKPYRTKIIGVDGVEQINYFGGSGNLEQMTRNGIIKNNRTINSGSYTEADNTDDRNNTTNYEYDSDNNITKKTVHVTLASGAAQTSVETDYAYQNGYLTQVTAPDGRSIIYQREPNGDIHKITKGGSLSVIDYNHLNQDHWTETTTINSTKDTVVKENEWDYSNENNITYTEKVNGITRSVTIFDRYGRVIQKTSGVGNDIYTYTDHTDKSFTVFLDRPGTNDVTYEFDVRGNLVKATDSENRITSYSYYTDDKTQSISSGGVTKTYTYKINGGVNAGLLDSSFDGEKTTFYDYNENGKITLSNVEGVTTEISYNDAFGLEERTITHNSTDRTINTINEEGWLLRSYYADGSEDLFTYDANGNRTGATHKKAGQSYQYIYTYDILNRLKMITYPGNKQTFFDYDESSNVISRSETGYSTQYVYDVYSRVKEIWPNGTLAEALEYDNGCLSCGAASSKITKDTITGYGEIDYSYTDEEWLDQTTYIPSTGSQTVIENSYDNVGNVKQVKLDGVLLTTYSYDPTSGRLSHLTDKSIGTDKIFDFTYDTVGHKIRIDYPNKNSMVYDYGTAYRLLKADGVLRKPTGDDIISMNEITERDAVGNITKKNTITGQNSYGYDNIYQLTNYSNAVSDVKSATYNYDYAGNRQNVIFNGSKAYGYTVDAMNQINSISDGITTTNFTYDDRGNMTGKGLNVYGWDYKNRCINASVNGKSISYKYNLFDNKLERSINGNTTRYFYNGNILLCEKDVTGKLLKTYTNDNEGVIGFTRSVYDAVGTLHNKQRLYYLFNEQGSVTNITNEIGTPIQTYFYDPYGNILNVENDSINNFTFIGRFGGQKDWDTGFIQFKHRWYDANIGRWISRDPIGVKGGINIYNYVKNNPTNISDTKGLCDDIDLNCLSKCLTKLSVDYIMDYIKDLPTYAGAGVQGCVFVLPLGLGAYGACIAGVVVGGEAIDFVFDLLNFAVFTSQAEGCVEKCKIKKW
jgi:RHS repeat-associated protein